MLSAVPHLPISISMPSKIAISSFLYNLSASYCFRVRKVRMWLDNDSDIWPYVVRLEQGRVDCGRIVTYLLQAGYQMRPK